MENKKQKRDDNLTNGRNDSSGSKSTKRKPSSIDIKPSSIPGQRSQYMATNSSQQQTWIIHVCPTTGGQLNLPVRPQDGVENIKKYLSRKLKIPKERISLLYKDKILNSGSILNNGIMEGAKLTLLPHIESGLISHKSESSVIQALEGLTDSQVNEFLSGRSPLTLAMRLGDHMMFIQLQLSNSQIMDQQHHRHRNHHHRHSSTSSSTSSPPPSPNTLSPSETPPISPVFPPGQVAPDANDGSVSNIPSQTITPPPTIHRPSPVSPVSTSRCPADTMTHPVMNYHHVCPSEAVPVSPGSSVTSTSDPVNSIATTAQRPSRSASKATRQSTSAFPFLDSQTIMKASKTLQSKLQEIQKNNTPHSPKCSSSHWTSGATIESMYNHGAGVYSGTFSGTLNPSLQDTHGKPLRNVSTIFHILNDLLGASPQYRAHLARQQQQHHKVNRHQQQQHQHQHHRSHRHHSKHRHRHNSQHQASLKLSHAKSIGEKIRLHEENRATKDKMLHIQQMMQEHKLKRQAKREAKVSNSYPDNNSYEPKNKKQKTEQKHSTNKETVTASGKMATVPNQDTSVSTKTVPEASSSDVKIANTDTTSTLYEDYTSGAMVA